MEQNSQQESQINISRQEINFSKGDAMASLIIGFIVGIFALFILNNLGKSLPFQNFYFIILPAIVLVGMRVVYLIGAKLPVIIQIAKFVAIGVLNTAIDFGILNLLSQAVNIVGGIAIIPLNIISFGFAVVNSYFWNKRWTFGAGKEKSSKQFLEFMVVSVIGALINTGIVFATTTFASPIGGMSDTMWLNIGKLMATFISLAWNFIGYKFIVFKR